MPHHLFISFAKKDQDFRDALVTHLAPLRNSGKLVIDDSTKVAPGAMVRPTRLALLERADVIALIVSPSFFDVEETNLEDLPGAIHRNSKAHVPIVPILVSECEIKDTPLEGRRILPSEDKPIGSPSNDKLLTEVVKSLRKVLDGLSKQSVAEPVAVTSLPLLPGASIGEKDLRQLIQKTLRAFLTAPPRYAGRLEEVFLHSVEFQDPVRWRERMAAAERCVCRIQSSSGGSGTGFLVGPQYVMTNAHVAEFVRTTSGAFQFDFKVEAGGSVRSRGVPFSAMKAEVTSPVAELDYAIFKLPEAIGAEPVAPGNKERGFLRPRSHDVEEREPLFVLQHPNGEVLKLCVGAAVSSEDAQKHRVYYEANTLPGSSGSPVFTIGWDLVALHHASDADVKANRGIPMKDILADLRNRNRMDVLGEPDED